MITLLDYGAGNVRSVRNAIRATGFEVMDVKVPEDITTADILVFPGVGSFGNAVNTLKEKGFFGPLRRYLLEDRPFLGICLGLQTLFEASDECPGTPGLAIIPGRVERFNDSRLSVPHIGWNGVCVKKKSALFNAYAGEKLYFVHSFAARTTPTNRDSVLTTTSYDGEFISSVQKGNVCATQFHPEKSGRAGQDILRNFLSRARISTAVRLSDDDCRTRLGKRIIACLDVRSNDSGDLVVTKGDQYDVREKGEVRNLGKPVELAKRYYDEGADEITFLNITAFRAFPLKDQPMIEVLRRSSEQIFVPLTIGGGIREFTDAEDRRYSALDVAGEYFRSGADKVSIGSDAVTAVADLLKTGRATGKSSIEEISRVYGNQAVVVSIDPRRVYVEDPGDTDHTVMETAVPGPNGEKYCWYQCTLRGGREGSDIDAVQLARGCEKLGAGEILLNCIDRDGTNSGFDLELINLVKNAVSIPVIASSGAGKVEHFSEVFKATGTDAALAAGVFHRREIPIPAVKEHLRDLDIEVR